MVSEFVKSIVRDAGLESKLRVGLRCRGPNGKLVEIVGGRYWGDYGVSNWWEWRIVLSDGSLSREVYSGYGWM